MARDPATDTSTPTDVYGAAAQASLPTETSRASDIYGAASRQDAPQKDATPQAADMPNGMRGQFEQAAIRYNVPVNVLMAIAQGTGYQPNAMGGAPGATRTRGMMAIPDTQAVPAGLDSYDTRSAIDFTAKALRGSLDSGASIDDAVKQAGHDPSSIIPLAKQIGAELYPVQAQQEATPQQPAPEQPKSSGFWGNVGDAARNLKIGLDTAAQDGRELASYVLPKKVVAAIDSVDTYFTGKPSDQLLKDDQQQMQAAMTPEMKAALDKHWWNSDKGTFGTAWTDWRAYASGALQSAPEMAVNMVPAMRLAKGVYAARIAAGLPVEAASKAAATAATAAGSLIEGALGGAQSSRAVGDTVRGLPQSVLDQSDAYKTLVSQGMNDSQARDALADNLSTRAFVTGGVATGIFGGMGDRVIAKLMTEEVKGSVLKRALKGVGEGALGEGLFEELPQSALQQVAQNEATQKADNRVGLGDDVMDQALGGAAIGAAQGGAIGGAAGLRHAAGSPPAQGGAAPGEAPQPPGPTAPSPQPGSEAQPAPAPEATQTAPAPADASTGGPQAPPPSGPLAAAMRRAPVQPAPEASQPFAAYGDRLIVNPADSRVDPFPATFEDEDDTHVVVRSEGEGRRYDIPKSEIAAGNVSVQPAMAAPEHDVAPLTSAPIPPAAVDPQTAPALAAAEGETGLVAQPVQQAAETAQTPVAAQTPASPRKQPKIIDLSGMADGISAGLRDALWSKIEAGDTKENGAQSNVLIAAKSVRDAGGLQTQADLPAFLNDWGQKVVGSGAKPGSAEYRDAAIGVMRDHAPQAAPLTTAPETTTYRPAPDRSYSEMAEPELRAKLRYIASQGKTNGWSKLLVDERRKVAAAIDTLNEKGRPDVALTGQAADPATTSNDRSAGQPVAPPLEGITGANGTASIHPAEGGFRVRMGDNDAPAKTLFQARNKARSMAGPSVATLDKAAARWFAKKDRAQEFIDRNGLADTHTIARDGDRFVLAPHDEAVAAASSHAATSPENSIAEPTDAQKEAGNYAKGHLKIGDLDISIENPAGTSRRPEWPPLKHAYGYARGTLGADGDHIDTFLSPQAHDTSLPVFVIDQQSPDGEFDEHKAMLGFKTAFQARHAYQANYASGWKGFGGIRKMSLDEFSKWARSEDATRPLSMLDRPAPDERTPAEIGREVVAQSRAEDAETKLARDEGSEPGYNDLPDDAENRIFLDGDPVATMRGNEVPHLGKVSNLVDWAAEHFNETAGSIVHHPQLGDIALGRRAAHDTLSHGLRRNKVQALYILPEALKQARVLNVESRMPGHKGYVLGAPVEIRGEPHVLAAVVRESPTNRALYVHEVILRKKLQDGFKTGASAATEGRDELATDHPGAIRSVLARIFSVKPDEHHDVETEDERDRRFTLTLPPEPRRANALNSIKALERKVGSLPPDEIARELAAIRRDIDARNETQKDRAAGADRARGVDYVRERLLRARRQGTLSEETVALGMWLLNQNPHLADELGISIGEGDGSAGSYNPASRIMRLSGTRARPGTAVHEIMHHAERLMPAVVQDGIRAEWAKALGEERADATGKRAEALDAMLRASAGDRAAYAEMRQAFNRGVLPYSDYQFANPSEFWAVNATRLLQERAEKFGWLPAARRWTRGLIQRLRSLLGMRSEAPVLRGLSAVLNGSAPPSGEMLWRGDAAMHDVPGAPKPDEPGRFQLVGQKMPSTAEAKDFVRNLLSDTLTRSMGGKHNLLATVPLRPLLEELGREMPAASDYLQTKQQMDALRSEWHQRVNTVATDWLKYRTDHKAENDKLMDLMHRSTLAQVDPSKGFVSILSREDRRALDGLGSAEAQLKAEVKERRDEERRVSYPEMKVEFDALSDDAKAIYARVRDSYSEMADEFETTLLGNIEKAVDLSGARAEREHADALRHIQEEGLTGAKRQTAIDEADRKLANAKSKGAWDAAGRVRSMRAQFETQRLTGPYFPLARFGDYFVTARDAEGAVVSFSRFERPGEQRRFAQKMKDAGHDVEIGTLSNDSEVKPPIDPRFMGDVERILEGANAPDSIRDAVWQRYLETLPDISVRKNRIHRKGTAGFVEDAMRAYASNMFHNSHQLARLRYAMDLQEHINRARDEAKTTKDPVRAGQVANEMALRNAYVMNPEGQAWAQKMTSAAFMYYLAASPASALVNLSQTAIMGIPILGAAHGGKAGMAVAAAQLGKAARDFAKGRGFATRSGRLTAQEIAAIDHAYEIGIIDRTQSHDLAGIGEVGVDYQGRRQRVMKAISWAFHHAERFNREATYLAAYRMARAKAMGHERAIEQAGRLTYKTHFDYQNTSRPRVMQGDVAKVLLTFRNFNVNMLYRLFRDTHQALNGATKEDRVEALHQLGGITAMMALTAGVSGTWMFGVSMALAGMFASALGDDQDPEEQLRLGAQKLIGPTLAKIVFDGLPGYVTGTSLSSRIGMGDLWFRSPDRQLEGADEYHFFMDQLLGAPFGVGEQAFDGLKLIEHGNVARGLEVMAPKVVRDLMKSYRYATEGATTTKGLPIMEHVPVADILKQALGFTPDDIAERYQINNWKMNDEKAIGQDRSAITSAYARALTDGDRAGQDRAMQKLDGFNARHPDWPITGHSVIDAARGRERSILRNDGGVVVNPRLQDEIDARTPKSIYRP